MAQHRCGKPHPKPSKIVFFAIVGLTIVFSADPFIRAPLSGWAEVIQSEARRFVMARETQWIPAIFVVLYGVYFGVVMLLRTRRAQTSQPRDSWPLFSLLCLLLWGAVLYFVRYSVEWQSTEAMVLLATFAIAAGVSTMWDSARAQGHQTVFRRAMVNSIIGLLAVASLTHFEFAPRAEYRAIERWHGPWENPNTFGVLMGVGLVLTLGLVLEKLRAQEKRPQPIVFVALLGLLVLFGNALLKSYSRGAWLATLIASALLLWESCTGYQRLRRAKPFLLLILLCSLILAYFSFHQGEDPLLRRFFSAGNLNDFSWRNRVTTYLGALQIMADHPIAGVGYYPTLQLYSEFYSPATLPEGKAIWSNDYLMMGAAFGLPFLLLFGCSITLVLLAAKCRENADSLAAAAEQPCKSETGIQVPGGTNACRSVLVLLLVSFFFDGGRNGGLFTLATAVPFWLLGAMATGGEALGVKPVAGRGMLTSSFLQRWSKWPCVSRFAVTSAATLLVVFLVVPPVQALYVKTCNPAHVTIGMRTRDANHQWQTLSSTSLHFLAAVWISEDARFMDHNGFDWNEIRAAIFESRGTGKAARGASTITQQCARSLFLWQGRSWIRKALEAYYTICLELLLSKERILELYINVIELGVDLYGVEAAAQHYYGIPSAHLNREQAASLVAIMPNPREWDPLNPNDRVIKRKAVILQRTENAVFPVNIDEK